MVTGWTCLKYKRGVSKRETEGRRDKFGKDHYFVWETADGKKWYSRKKIAEECFGLSAKRADAAPRSPPVVKPRPRPLVDATADAAPAAAEAESPAPPEGQPSSGVLLCKNKMGGHPLCGLLAGHAGDHVIEEVSSRRGTCKRARPN